MPGCARVGDTINTGHLCDTTATIIVGSNDVFVNGKSATFLGSDISSHQIESQRGVQPPGNPPGSSTCIPHPNQKVYAGSTTVKVNGKPMARKGDSADAGSITGGSTNVFAGG